MIRGAIFDVDGTLLDSMGIWDDAGERFLNKNGIQAKPGLRDVLFTMSLPEGAEYLIREYHVDMPPEEIIRGVATVVSDFYIYNRRNNIVLLTATCVQCDISVSHKGCIFSNHNF